MQERFNKQFVDEDTGLLNIGKYDYDEVMEFIENENKIIVEKIKDIIPDERKQFQIGAFIYNSYEDKELIADVCNKIINLIETNETS